MPRREKDIANLDMVARMIAAAGRTLGGYDPDQLPRLIGLVDSISDAMVAAIAGQRAAGATWAAIGDALGVSAQAAFQRYAERVAAHA